jgi:ribonuclease HI
MTTPHTVVIHADESCLGNGREGANPGGAGALIELCGAGPVTRYDCFIAAPDTTNNRMALSGAIAALALVGQIERRATVVFVSDSEYLVKGMREWVPGWIARGWRRKAGAVENLELWQALVEVAAGHRLVWRWARRRPQERVRGQPGGGRRHQSADVPGAGAVEVRGVAGRRHGAGPLCRLRC